MCEDYRAGLGIDRANDEADRAAGRRIGCPTRFLYSLHDDMELLYGDPLAIWRAWADDVSGGTIDSGHHMAEEAPGRARARARSRSFADHDSGTGNGCACSALATATRFAAAVRPVRCAHS